jgi:serine/threonine protein kinase/tetratricopeptide (TPR) repeat protein
VIGETISHYRVVQRLGEGAMGEVYLAEDLRLRRPVALKMLRAERNEDPEARERLMGEARAASALNHPHIAVVYEIDEVARATGPLRFIAMEYVAGESFAEVGRRRDLDLDTILDLGLQVADALVEAHARGIVHRDVKPSNLLVTDSGRVKVLDFGLAQYCPPLRENDMTWTREPGRERDHAGLLGTLAYMAPEQARGDEIDGRADEFSLGAVLYELVSSRSPFGRANAVQTLDAILHQEPAPLSARRHDPRLMPLEVVLRRMLAKDRTQRYSDLREVASDLRSVRNGHDARGPSLPPTPGRTIAVLDFANITGSGEDDWIGTGIAETVTSDLKGVSGLAVISRARVHECLRGLVAGQTVEPAGVAAWVGRALGARWVVTGGFQRAAESVRVTAQLLEVGSGQVGRTVKLDGRLAEIFELQDRIVRDLAEGLRLDLQPGDTHGEETQVVEAYEAYAKGLLNVRDETFETLDRGMLLFERAATLDPGYARAHMELASALSAKADYLAAPELHERALVAFRRALELNPGLVRAWREMGWVLLSLGRDDEGREAVERALALDPTDAGALGAMARALFIGRADFAGAADWFDRALERNPRGGWFALQLSHCSALLRDFPRGEAAAARAVSLQEAFLSGQEGIRIIGAYMRLGHLAALQDRPAQALAHFDKEVSFLERVEHALRGRISIELQMRRGTALSSLGRPAEAAGAFESALRAFDERVRLGADDPFTRYYAAAVHAQRGEALEAAASLEKAARRRRRFTLVRALREPEFSPLRQEPAFMALAETLGH